MCKEQKNRLIRFFIVILSRGNKLDTRTLIAVLSRLLREPKQRICGNLSFLACSGVVTIHSNRPYSTVAA